VLAKRKIEEGGGRSESNKTKLTDLKKEDYNDKKNPNSH